MELVETVIDDLGPGISSYVGPRGSGKSYQLAQTPGLIVDLASFTQEELSTVELFFVGVLQRLLKSEPALAHHVDAFSSEAAADKAGTTFAAHVADPAIRGFLTQRRVVFDSFETLINTEKRELGASREKQSALGFDATAIFTVLETLAQTMRVVCSSRFSLPVIWERMKTTSRIGPLMPPFPELLKTTPTKLLSDWSASRIEKLLSSNDPKGDSLAAREIERLTGGTLEFVVPFTKELSQPPTDRSRDDVIGLLANKLQTTESLLTLELRDCRNDAELWTVYDEVLGCQQRIEPNLDDWQHARLLAAGLVTVREDERGRVLRSRNLIVEGSIGRSRLYARRVGAQLQSLAAEASEQQIVLSEPALEVGVNELLQSREKRALSLGQQSGFEQGKKLRTRMFFGLGGIGLIATLSTLVLLQSRTVAGQAAESASDAAKQAVKGRSKTAEQVEVLLNKEADQRQLDLEGVSGQLIKANEAARLAQGSYDAAFAKVQSASARSARDAKATLDRAQAELNIALAREKALTDRLALAQLALDRAQTGAAATKASRDALLQQLSVLSNAKGDLQLDLESTKTALSTEQGQRELLANQLQQNIEGLAACRGLVSSVQDDVTNARTERDTMKASRDATQRQLDDCRRQLPALAQPPTAKIDPPAAKP
jgi:hypothetical protein